MNKARRHFNFFSRWRSFSSTTDSHRVLLCICSSSAILDEVVFVVRGRDNKVRKPPALAAAKTMNSSTGDAPDDNNAEEPRFIAQFAVCKNTKTMPLTNPSEF
mmetsp:Transcript_40816/g.65603  ORF Transcript_40816/g.65603 Transcript_40816/m.65603 type:complete len:103 (+) Transcript_40816:908-1216(+)